MKEVCTDGIRDQDEKAGNEGEAAMSKSWLALE